MEALQPVKFKQSSFTTIVVFIVLIILGLAIFPRISIHLKNTTVPPILSISYGYPGRPPRIVEQEESMSELKEALDFWNKIADKAVSRKFLTFGLFKNDEKRIPYYERRIPCFLLYDRINIDVGGIIRLCGYDSFGKTNFGEIRNTSIQDAWKSEKLKGIRELHQSARFEEVEICKDCVDWPFHSWQKNYMEE